MQTFRIRDAFRCSLVNAPRGPNLAWPRDRFLGHNAPRPAALWLEALTQRRDRVTQVQWEGMRLGGLASARVRTGCRVWEVDRLYLPSDQWQVSGDRRTTHWESGPLQLLEQLTREVGAQQAERIFLRLPADSPLVPLARRAGLFPYYEETLLERRDSPPYLDGSDGAPVVLRDRTQEDDYRLFQLYSAATPQQVRVALGITFDQWRDAQEPCSGRRIERLTEKNGRLTGWLVLWSRGAFEAGAVVVHPDHPESLSALFQLALSRRGPLSWLVPDYQILIKSLLLHHEFREAERYVVLIKTMAVRATIPGMARVEA